MRTSSCESRVLIQSRLNLWATRTAAGLVTLRFAILWRGIAQRAGLEKIKALAVKTLWLQQVVRERGLQIKSISSVVPKNLKINKLSNIKISNASIFTSSLIVPNLLSNLFVSLMNVLRMSSSCSRLWPCLVQRCC